MTRILETSPPSTEVPDLSGAIFGRSADGMLALSSVSMLSRWFPLATAGTISLAVGGFAGPCRNGSG